ncbi:MAG: hypothetical protein FJ382_11885 [Verrucomicrobia bacterium]|nr:hypothetical protein [Verrucomicrobiota bacterium]
MPRFDRHLGIDYSGAGTADTPLTGLRLFEATAIHGALGDPSRDHRAGPERDSPSVPTVAVVPPRPDAAGNAPPVTTRELRPGAGRGHWTRRGLAAWLAATLTASRRPIMVGIDHGFSFPEAYFAAHGVPRDWHRFLPDFCAHWPSDAPGMTVEALRHSRTAGAARRGGQARWRRLAEVRSGPAKSVFHFDVPGSVAKSTHAGLPWIHLIGERVGWHRLHVWPFDGWTPRPGCHVLAEVYPSRWSRALPPRPDHTPDQHDAACVAAALAAADRSGELEAWWSPPLTPAERRQARYEGWILGVEA